MVLYSRQVRGIIAVAFILAIIPFFHFLSDRSPDVQGPIFSISGDSRLAIEIIDNARHSGIYFVDPSTPLIQLIRNIDSNVMIGDDFELKEGMSVTLITKDGKTGVEQGRISAEKRIALGMPLDINRATKEELILIPGLGEATAQKIIARRQETGKFKKINQLSEIKGIKEKKLIKLFKYLYVE